MAEAYHESVAGDERVRLYNDGYELGWVNADEPMSEAYLANCGPVYIREDVVERMIAAARAAN